jgi:hypothetical protein
MFTHYFSTGVSIVKMNLFKMMFAVGVLTFVSFAGAANLRAQDSDRGKHERESQKSAASKSAKFEMVSKTDKAYTSAIDAHDLSKATKMLGQEGAFRGKVAKLYTSRTGTIVSLNFDDDYKTALTAVVKGSDFSKFPDLSQLDGKQVVVSGTFSEFKGNPQILLTDPKQIAVVSK